MDETPFRQAVDGKMMPVSFGDVVHDDSWEYSVLSADTIAVALARRLPIDRVVFVSDVMGVWDPGEPAGRKIVTEISPDLLARLRPRSVGPDVTGGIRAKIEAMMSIATSGADAGLISGLTDGALSRALRGGYTYGTWAKGVPR
jgi:isopentenyl phosphate kinase